MSQFSKVWKTMGYSFGTAAAASLAVLLIGMCVFGVQFSEWEGRFLGVVGTIAGIVGAVVGLWLSCRKSMRNIVLVGGTLLIASTTESKALPPRQHSISGVIKTINYDAHTITLAPSEGDKPLVFAWKDYTRFIHRGSRVCYAVLIPGMAVKISYRRDIGQLVPYWAYLARDAEVRCECCAKPS